MATGRTFVFWSMRFDARSPWQNARASEMRNGHLSMMYVIMKPLSLRCDTVRASNRIGHRIKFKRLTKDKKVRPAAITPTSLTTGFNMFSFVSHIKNITHEGSEREGGCQPRGLYPEEVD